MCFVAGALGLTGLAGNLFNASLALSAVTGVMGAAAKNEQARQTASYAYQAAEATAISADNAMTRQQEATNAKLSDDRKATAQAKLEKDIERKRAVGKIYATEGRSGRLATLLTIDAERNSARMKEVLTQELESAEEQYFRDVEQIVANRDSRRNQATDIANRGYMQAQQMYQSPLSVIANVASTGLGAFTAIAPHEAAINSLGTKKG
jgi:hypothetical protein